MAKSPLRSGGLYKMALWLQLAWVATTNSFYLFCPPCDQMPQCPPVRCSESLLYYDECGCCALCAKFAGQLCGGWLNTAGECGPGLRCTYRLGSIYGEDRVGRCEPELCSQTQCGYREICNVVDISRSTDIYVPSCRCPPYPCFDKENPVCGNNGVTYSSVCELRKYECNNDIFIGIRYLGACTPPTPPPPTIPPKPRTETTPPGDGDPFGTLFPPTPEEITESVRGCLYMGRLLMYNEMVQADSRDPCIYMSCTANGILSEVLVPGCWNAPAEVDYGENRLAVVGGWTRWSQWSECAGPSCYNASQTRTRNCTNPPPRNEGRPCKGDSIQTKKCIPEACAANFTCVYSEWSDWSDCNVTCGTGTQVRSRTLVQNILDESLCTLEQSRTCDMNPCVTGRCRPRRVEKKLVNRNGCTTISAHVVKFCGGDRCDSGGVCEASAFRERTYAVKCPSEFHFRDWGFQIPTECHCVGGDTSGDSDASDQQPPLL